MSTSLTPRKSPVQARSAASVDAIREATVQVLLDVGKQRLTTTRVARRAGVSIGTLYQYFPNKSALLHHALKHHLDIVCTTIENACSRQAGQPLQQMITAVLDAYLSIKLGDPALGSALYAVAADVDGMPSPAPTWSASPRRLPACSPPPPSASPETPPSSPPCSKPPCPAPAAACSNPPPHPRRSNPSAQNLPSPFAPISQLAPKLPRQASSGGP